MDYASSGAATMPAQTDLPLRAALMQAPPADRVLTPGLPRQRPLATRVWHTLAQMVWDGLPVRYLGTMPLFDGHRVYGGPRTDWVVLNLADDPLFHDRHGFPIPTRVLDDLRRIRRSVELDALFVAHEVPRGAVAEERPVPATALMPSPPREVAELSAGLGAMAQGLWLTAAVPLVASGLIGALVAGGAAVIGGSLALDPVLLGVLVEPGRSVKPGEPGAWFCLGQWTYGEA